MPSIALPVSLRGQLLNSVRSVVFNPISLFAANEPGVWYDPSDVANLAWRRNLLTFTEQFDNAAWTKTNSSITANAVSAPDGTTTADKLVENTANSTHTASQAFTTSASTSYTFTVYAKADTRSHLDLSALTGFTTNPIVRFTLSGSGASSVRQGSPTPTHSIQSVGDGWYRCQINVTTVAGGSSTFQVALAVDASSSNFYTGDGTSGLFLWGAQLELGSTVTAYQRITDVNTEVIERFPTATLYQDTAGTQPVTTPGQTVALALDKSKGLVLGPELVTNGDFSNGSTGWGGISGRVAIVGGKLVATVGAGNTSTTQTILTVGTFYRVTLSVEALTGTGAVFLGNTTLSLSVGNLTFTAQATGSGTLLVRSNDGGSFTIDNISVRELPGFHATQATAASRPTYGIVPATGRRNLLTRTEEFDNAAWSKSNTTVTANAATAPDGANTADKATPDTSTTTKRVGLALTASGTSTWSFSFYAKADGYSRIGLWDYATSGAYAAFLLSGAGSVLDSGSGAVGAAISSIGNGWYRCSFRASVTGSVGFGLQILPDSYTTGAVNSSWAGNGTSGILIWGAQLETGSSATAYQRVGSAFDVTEAGVASLSYLSFDGVDDFLLTPTITPGTDKAQVFAGVRKLSDAAGAVLVEHSAAVVSNAGAFAIFAPSSAAPNYLFRSRGSATQVGADYTNALVAAPITNVLSGIGDISGDIATLRVNSIQVAQSTADQGTGNYLAYPIYIGRRGGTANPFNGNLFSLIVRFGTNLDAGTITSTETWVAGKTGVTL